MVFDIEKSKSYDLRHFTDAKNNLSQLIHDFDKYKYQVELKKEALRTEPGFLEKSINKIFDFINSIIDRKDHVVSFIKSRINLVIEFNNRQILAFNRNGLKLTHKLEEYFLAFTNFRKNYRDKAFEASSKSVELLTNSVSNTTNIYSQTISSVKQVVPTSPQVLLRAAAIFGLVTALILPVNSIVAFAEETPTEVVSTETPSESVPTSEPTASASPEPSASEAIEVGSEVIVEETPVTEPSPEVSESVSPTPSPTVSVPLVVVNAPTNLGFTPVVEGIKLTWDKTDSEIDKYIVKVDPDGRQIDVSKDVNELLLADLDRKATYSFSIWAVSGEVSSEVTSPVTVDLSTVKFPRPPMNAEVGGLIVKFEGQELSSQDLTNLADNSQLQPVSLEVSSEIATDTHLVEFNQPVDVTTANEIADALEANNNVEYAELDFAFLTASETNRSESFVPNDPLYATKQWTLWGNFGVGIADGPTGLALAYQNSTGLGSVVAVIDTGFTNHPDLEGQFVSGYDFVSNNEMLSGIREENGNAVPYDGDYVDQVTYGPIGWDDNPLDPGDWNSSRSSSWHGTYIAGLIAAKTNNEIGIAGIAPDSKIQPIRAFSWRGGLLSDVIASITWASGGTVENVPANQTPAKVINLSFSVEAPCTPSLQLAIDEAIERGSVVVAAAGNNNQDAANFAPGNCQNVITVGAINSDGEKAAYSNFGSSVDISAPGGELDGQAIYSTSNEGTTTSTNPAYVVRQGTSIATAQVSAALAKLAQTYPSENAIQLKARVLSKEATKPFPSGKCLTDKNCGIGYLFFGISVNYPLNNNKLRFGNGTESSVNSKGLLQQPFYKSSVDGSFYKLTYSSYPLNFSVGTGTSGPNWTTNTVVDLPNLTSQTIDYSSYVSAGGKTYGTVTSVGQATINLKTFEFTNIYVLGENDSYIKITSKVKNVSGSTVSNVSLWTGTQDDWVGGTDSPTKTKGSLATGAFVAIPNKTTLADALEIKSGAEGVLFYSTSSGINMSIDSCCSFSNAYNVNPINSEITRGPEDGSYAMYVPVGTLTNNQEFSFDWFYAAGALADLGAVAAAVSAAGAPSVPTTTPGDASATVTWDAVTPPAGSTLVRYEIDCSPDCGTNSSPIQVTGATTRLITGLTNGTNYTFRVRAVTSSGSPAVETNGDYSSNSASTTIGTPRNNAVPTISGTVAIGNTLTAADGTWESGISDSSMTTTYQWQSCSSTCDTLSNYSNITGAISSTYLITGTEIGKKLRVQVTKTNAQSRSATAVSVGTSSTVPTPTLTNLVISNGTLIPTFSTSQATYSVSLGYGIENITLTPTLSSGSVTINGVSVTSGSASGNIALSVGTNTITISVTASSITSIYTIIVTRAAASGGSSAPTATPTPTPTITNTTNSTPTPRPTNLINNPLVIPTPTPSPSLIPGTVNRPEPLVPRIIDSIINALRPRIVDLTTSPTPQATTNSTSQPPTFTNQQALQIAQPTEDKKVVELPSLVLVDNVYQPSKVVIVDNTTAQIVTPGGGLLSVAAKDGEERIPVDNRGRVQMVRDNNVETQGQGLASNTEFAVYLFSEPKLLGVGKTDAQGNFYASFPVENELPIGDHTLQVNGLLPDGKTASVSMPVVIVDSIETAKNQAMPETVFVSENPVQKALRALYWMLIVLAVMMFLIAAANRKRFFALFRRRDKDEEPQTI
jgi:serine protease